MAHGQFCRITRVDQVNELDTFHYSTGRHVQAGNDSAGQHPDTFMKFSRIFNPKAPDFSGWNCTAIQLPFSTAAEKAPP
jgi:hypothetical protein